MKNAFAIASAIAVIMLILLTYFFAPLFSGTVKIDNGVYPFEMRYGIPKITCWNLSDIELGMNYGEFIEKYGEPNGCLNLNGIPTWIYYRIGVNKYAVINFKWNDDLYWWKEIKEGRLIGVHVYSSQGIVKTIKNDFASVYR